MKTITLTTPQRHALRDCVQLQCHRHQDLAALMRAEGKPEPERNKRARIELAKVLGLLEIDAHEVPAL